MKFKKRNDGFTLVELVVVIAILGILAGVGTVGYSGYIKKANIAADQTVLHALNQAFAVACIDNGTDIGNIDDADIDVTDKEIKELTSVTLKDGTATLSEFNDALKQYFGTGNKFKVYTSLVFKDGVFVAPGASALSSVWAPLLGTFDAGDVDKLNDSTFGTMDVPTLLGSVVLASDLAAGLLTQEIPDTRVQSLLYSDENWKTVASVLNVEYGTEAFGSAYNDLLNQKMEIMKNDPKYAAIADDEEKLTAAARASILANTAVISIANNDSFDAESFAASFGKTGGESAKEVIKTNLQTGDLATGLSQAGMTYALYVSYAQKNNLSVDENLDLYDVLEAMETEGFQDYITGEDGTTNGMNDIEGYLAAMSMVNTSYNNKEAAKDILLNGYGVQDLELLLQSTLEQN